MTATADPRDAIPRKCRFTVPGFGTHRVQETPEALPDVLGDLTHVVRGEEDVI